jgi:hypothetical protein
VLQPTNAAERFVFAQAYETLINVDCEGRAYPGLAASWTTDATKTRVTLTLREGSHFWNGDALDANAVAAAWRESGQVGGDVGDVARRVADGTTIVDSRTLTVSLPDTEWLVLASPSLSVWRPRTGVRLPEGSGPYRLIEPAADIAPGRLALLSRGGARLIVRTTPSADARDAIDAGADLVPSADPTTVRYAAARPELSTVPLPWQRTYVVAIPGSATGTLSDVIPSAGDSAQTIRASLARDAVRADARPASASGWWSNIQGCQSRPATTVPDRVGRRPRIVYSSDDHVARDIADRLVALGGHLAATPLAPPEFTRALSSGGDAAYVVSLPHASLAPCHEVAHLVSSAPWIAVGGALAPLVDTRERAIVNRARVSATVDWDGTLKLRATP